MFLGYNIIGDSMKRVLETILLLALVFLIFQILSSVLKKGHEIDYVLSVDNKKFNINEVYKQGYYHISIVEGNNHFSIFLDDNYNKNKKIIKDVLYTFDDNMECIYPVTSKKDLNVVCSKGSTIYSYSMVKNNSLVTGFVKKLKNDGYDNKGWNDADSTKNGKVSYYASNLEDKSSLYVWKYNGFYTIRDGILNSYDMFNRDIYNNNLGIAYDNKYVVADYAKKYDFDNLIVFNMTNDTFKKVTFDQNLSYNTYFNGVVDNKLYLIDPTNLLQYEVNLKNYSYKLIGTKDLNGLYYNNGKWETINIYDFTKSKLIFKYYDIPNNLTGLNVTSNMYESNDVYFYKKDGTFYMYDGINDLTTHLFDINNVKSIQTLSGNLYFIVEDTLYSYNDRSGILPLFKNNEFKFNSNNIYGVYIK